jgi:hypothetical protein
MTTSTPQTNPDETPLEALRRIIANADCLEEDSVTQAVFLFRNRQVLREVIASSMRTIQGAPKPQVVAALTFLRSF